MAITFDDTLNVIEKTFTVIGLSEIYMRKSSHSHKYQVFQRSMYTFAFCHLFILVIFEMVFVSKVTVEKGLEKFLKLAEVLPCVIVSIFGLFKSITVVLKRRVIVELVESLRRMWPQTRDAEINGIVLRSMGPTKLFCLVYSVVTNVLSLVYNIFPLIVMMTNYAQHGYTEMLLPYYIWYPVDWSTFSWKYVLIYISQCYAGIISTSGVSCVDCFFCLTIAQVCMQLQILCKDIREVPCRSKDPNNTVKSKLRRAIEFHNNLIKLSAEVESIFSTILLFNLVLSSMMICILLFSITISPPGLLVKYLLFLSSSLSQILMMSWFGNKLLEESNNVAKAAYDSSWTDLENGPEGQLCRFGILMIQAKSKRPITISAMGFTNISMATFTSILSASWSYFTLLRTVYQQNMDALK